MTLLKTQGSARVWGGVCFASAERSGKAGKSSRLTTTSKSALPSHQRCANESRHASGVTGGSGAARRGRAMGLRL